MRGLIFKGDSMADDIREKQITKTSFIGIITNVLLAGFKAFVGLLAGAVSVVLDAVNNLTDAISSVITIIGIKLAKKKPDKKHPFGYGRIEYFSAILVAAIVLVAGITAGIESVKKIITPETPDYSALTLIVIGVAVVVKIILGKYVKTKGKKYNSEALVASGSDATFDAIITASTLAGGVITLLTGFSVDGIVGTLISLFIIKAGLEMLLTSVSSVMGSRVDSAVSTEMKAAISEVDGVNGVYDLVLHNYGPDFAIGSVHIEINSALSAEEIYGITRNIQNIVLEKYRVFLTVGIYPFNEKYRDKRDEIEKIAFFHDGVIQVHGFHVEEDKKQFSVDIVADFTVKDKKGLLSALTEEFEKVFPEYSVYINFDVDYSD